MDSREALHAREAVKQSRASSALITCDPHARMRNTHPILRERKTEPEPVLVEYITTNDSEYLQGLPVLKGYIKTGDIHRWQEQAMLQELPACWIAEIFEDRDDEDDDNRDDDEAAGRSDEAGVGSANDEEDDDDMDAVSDDEADNGSYIDYHHDDDDEDGGEDEGAVSDNGADSGSYINDYYEHDDEDGFHSDEANGGSADDQDEDEDSCIDDESWTVLSLSRTSSRRTANWVDCHFNIQYEDNDFCYTDEEYE
ncbi:hypothetical protein K490DRAFT_56866 [Saccharata proteae CBS 121410]|uniref:Transcription factor Iwr1 domain-containing protein n=1 Tax=Saccharata proteae CBS 121410 TaxID=1314787 RepID=A0A9P4HW00_9PEZI|nr:hypothetical protein K490DRAFT_56866 [Saccharata proteae CBS 121410]